MDEQQAHDPKQVEAKLSAVYANAYCPAREAPEGSMACTNCGTAVVRAAEDTKDPLCEVCWAMLQASIKRAARLGFRIGS